jgi:hypothetical protein
MIFIGGDVFHGSPVLVDEEHQGVKESIVIVFAVMNGGKPSCSKTVASETIDTVEKK